MTNGQPAQPVQQVNGLGLAGFICSLVGFCTGGLLSPIGLILSLIALGKPPRGFAIAGVVIGALGSCGIIIAVLFFPLALIGMLGALGIGAGLASLLGPDLEVRIDTIALQTAIADVQSDTGRIPISVDELTEIPEFLRRDPWGRPYSIYQIPTNDFVIVSYGEDGQPGTDDDWFLRSTSDDVERGSGWQTLVLPAPAPGSSAPAPGNGSPTPPPAP